MTSRFCCRQQQEKKGKGREGALSDKYRYVMSPIWGTDPFGLISTKIGTVEGVDDVIIQSNFSFSVYMGFRFAGGGGVKFSFSH